MRITVKVDVVLKTPSTMFHTLSMTTEEDTSAQTTRHENALVSELRAELMGKFHNSSRFVTLDSGETFPKSDIVRIGKVAVYIDGLRKET